jgi:acetyl-CoA acetyltransferase
VGGGRSQVNWIGRGGTGVFRGNARHALCTVCVGVGEGMAMVLERV